MHCLQHADERTWDHVFPKSWYPETTPRNLAKWKIPSCKRCNHEYGRIEEDLGLILSFCVYPDRDESRGVYKRMLRSLDPKHATNEKDRRVRERKKETLQKRLLHGNEIPAEGIYPGLGERWNRPRSAQIAFRVPKKHIDSVGEKIVRGLLYIHNGRFIEDTHEIEHYALEELTATSFAEAIARYGHSLARGPGIVVERAITQEDGISSIHKITIWGDFITYVVVLPK